MVVAPEEYSLLGRKLSAKISRISGYRGIFQNVEKYIEDSSPVIFLGSPEENVYTKKIINSTDNLKNRSGACYAYQGSKAIIFGDGNLESAKELKEVLEKYGKGLINAKKHFLIMLTKKLKLLTKKTLIPQKLPPIISLLQTDAAASFFLKEAFKEWV